MKLIVIVGALAALIGLWIVICRTDLRKFSPQSIAALFMVCGVAVFLMWALGSKAVTVHWLQNGAGALLFGISIWLAFDRRKR